MTSTSTTAFYTSLFGTARKGAIKRGHTFTLTRAEFDEVVRQAQGQCMITGIPFDFDPHPTASRRPFAPSLDRIDSSAGYTADNIRLVCVIVNFAMNEWGLGPLRLIAEKLAAGPILPAILPPAPEEYARHHWNDETYMSVHDYLVMHGREVSGIQEGRLASRALAYCRKYDIPCIDVRRGSNRATWSLAYPVRVLGLVC